VETAPGGRAPPDDTAGLIDTGGRRSPLRRKGGPVVTVAPSSPSEFERHSASQRPQYVPDQPAQFKEICHDLRQPIATILMLASAASSESGLPPSVLHRLGQIAEQAEWMSCLLRRSLEDDGDAFEVPEVADLREVVSRVAEMARAGFTGSMSIHQVSSSPLLVHADPVLLHRAIGNLLSNAFRAAGPQGSVALRLRRRRGAATVEIEDDGPGFGRVVSGQGIGLGITQRLAAACGGYVDIEDGAQGGTLARLWIPTVVSDGPRGTS
jgi:signal transduction histidine kinase